MADVERVLFVHAHPDDETIETGGTIATLVDRGAQVSVLTCTRGERGEVVASDLKPALESHGAMASLRGSELATAMAILGVRDHRFLGDDNARWSGQTGRTYVDSGMRWGRRGAEAAGHTDPATLTAADLSDVTSDIASVVIAVGPDAVISYDEDGGYGHPDHIRVHDAARRAADIYGVPFYSIVTDRADGRTRRADEPTISLDVSPVLDRKRRALEAYRSQLSLDGDEIVLSGGQRIPVSAVERFALREPASDVPAAFSDQHPASRFVVMVLAAIIGVAFGALLSVYNQSTALIAGQPIWVGTIGVVVVVAALLAGFRLVFGTRVVAGFAAVGIIVIVGILSILGAGGSVLIPWNGPGIVWQIAPAVIGIAVVVWPHPARHRPGRIGSTPLKGLQHQ
ncbi:MAG TPA: PIG-L family deacetylase [Galbitalea sp.]|jgi:N-acetyl-1-D-myo-inositol-2-amino-2-deoxy-alpha-D-glucopyranoside deacetylase|nr:PIG-L family deacetylase [Galbitalea sp.]